MADETNVEELVAAADQQLGDTFEDDFEEAPEQEAAPQTPEPQAEAPDPLDVEIPLERLSGYWRQKAAQTGKPVTYRDLEQAALTAEEKIRQQGETANAARDEVRVLRARMEAQEEILREIRNPKIPPRAPSYEDVGVRDPNRALLEDPAHYGTATAQLGARLARAEMDPRIQTVEQQLAELRQQTELAAVRNAAEEARMALNIPPEKWRPLGGFLYAHAGAHELGPKHPDAWRSAYEQLTTAFPQPEPRTTLPREGIVRGNPAGSARPTPVQAQAKPNGRVRGLVSAVDQEAIKAGLDPEVAKMIAQRTEEKLRRQEAKE